MTTSELAGSSLGPRIPVAVYGPASLARSLEGGIMMECMVIILRVKWSPRQLYGEVTPLQSWRQWSPSAGHAIQISVVPPVHRAFFRGLRNLLTKAAKLGRSCSFTATNLNPRPVGVVAWRTTASALICPSCTRKSIVALSPTGRVSTVSTNRPPKLRFRTRDTSSRPPQDQ